MNMHASMMTPYLSLDPSQVTPELMALFEQDEPAAVRCLAVLENHAAGVIMTDHPETPTWGVVQEAAFGSIYLGGDLSSALLSELISNLRAQGDVLVGLREVDPRWSLVPPGADYSGVTLEFMDRVSDSDLPELPAGCTLHRLDHSLSKQILDRNLLMRMFGSIQNALEWGYGLCLMNGDKLLCEAFAGPSAVGVIEIGVETQPHHMHKGYATLTCSHLIHLMEGLGFQTYWNCSKQNAPSTALARRLGYKTEKEYRLLAWNKVNRSTADRD
jgi:hypothetical protein